MVQNQVTISASMVSRGLPPSQVLAEGQESADVKHDFTILPPSASQDSWRRGSNFPRDMQIFAFRAIIWRRGVNSPRKMQVSGNHQHNRKGRFIRLANDGNSLAENDTQLGHAMAASRAAVDFKGAKRSNESRVDLFLASRGKQDLGCQFTPRQTGGERLGDHIRMPAQRRSAVPTVANHGVQVLIPK